MLSSVPAAAGRGEDAEALAFADAQHAVDGAYAGSSGRSISLRLSGFGDGAYDVRWRASIGPEPVERLAVRVEDATEQRALPTGTLACRPVAVTVVAAGMPSSGPSGRQQGVVKARCRRLPPSAELRLGLFEQAQLADRRIDAGDVRTSVPQASATRPTRCSVRRRRARRSSSDDRLAGGRVSNSGGRFRPWYRWSPSAAATDLVHVIRCPVHTRDREDRAHLVELLRAVRRAPRRLRSRSRTEFENRRGRRSSVAGVPPSLNPSLARRYASGVGDVRVHLHDQGTWLERQLWIASPTSIGTSLSAPSAGAMRPRCFYASSVIGCACPASWSRAMPRADVAAGE